MSLPSELLTALPASLPPSRVRAAFRSPGSPGSLGGESWLLELDDGLAMLCRSSIFDSLEWLALADDGAPAVQLSSNGFTSTLEVRCADGTQLTLRPSSTGAEAVTALLERVQNLAAAPGSTPDPAPTSQTSAAVLLDSSPSELEPPTESPAPEPSGSLDHLNGSLARGDFRSAELAARQTSSASEPEAHADLVALLELAAAGELAAAYLWTRGARRPPARHHHALFAALASALERDDEPTLAWSAWERIDDDRRGSEARGRIERALGRTGPTIAREVAERARTWFNDQLAADPEQVDALRGLAHAHTDLDELEAARRWVDAALAKDPHHFDTRMHAVQILALLELETGDGNARVGALQAIATDFPTRAEPLLELADHVEFDDPTLAIQCLVRALEREFTGSTAVALVDLYAATKRYGDVMTVATQALKTDQLDAREREHLQRQLEQAQVATGLRTDGELTQLPPQRSRGAAVVVLVILAMLGWLLLQ
ncbi:tetratricopeptide repeat protein [Enhygromyxa salina]|uniref:tetratricopeptide repeat protein n=1 Tax=Enhygromyxa salina TaxID=215803 RepID=UPI0011B2152D|nr:hypothetical protein [Enhygromyxa salina]